MLAAASAALSCASCAGCCVCQSLLNCALSRCTRLAYASIALGVFVLAYTLGKHVEGIGLNDIDGARIEDGCDEDFVEDCLRNQMIYRASFVMTLFFVFFAALSGVTFLVDKGLWTLKIVLPLVLLFVSIWIDNSVFEAWSELSRAVSFVWLLFQSLLVLEVAFELHEFLIVSADQAEARRPGGGSKYLYLYLGICIASYTAGTVGVALLFAFHACPLANFFTSFTLVLALASSIASSLDVINGGILTPSVVYVYAVYLNWYAVASSPDTGCNDLASESNDTKHERDTVATFAIIFMTVVVFWIAWHGTSVLSVFASNEADGFRLTGDGRKALVEGSSDVPTIDSKENVGEDDEACCCCAGKANAAEEKYSNQRSERVFFHIVMAFTVLHACMTVTSWGTASGEPVGEAESDRPFVEAMWMKIVAQWLMYAFYARCLYVLYIDRE